MELGKQSVPVLEVPDWWDIIKTVVPLFLIVEGGVLAISMLAVASDAVDDLLDLGPLRFGLTRIWRITLFATAVAVISCAWFARTLVYPSGYLLSIFLGPRRTWRRVAPTKIVAASKDRAVTIFTSEHFPGRWLLAFEALTDGDLVKTRHVVDVTGTPIARALSINGAQPTESQTAELPGVPTCDFYVGLPGAYLADPSHRTPDPRLIARALPDPVHYHVRRYPSHVVIERSSATGAFAGITVHSTLEDADRQLSLERASGPHLHEAPAR